MKKNFKKSLAVLMAVLMLLSAVGVTCLAAYTITYNPGTYGNETDLIVTVEVPGKQTIKASEALYTRDGYVQTGWSTSKSGSRMAVECGGDYEVTRSRTLYPYWEAKGQQVTFAPGEFGVGAEMKFCGDNAAMIASQGYYEFIEGKRAGLTLNAVASMPITEA